MNYRINNLAWALDIPFADLANYYRSMLKKRTTTTMVVGQTGAGKSVTTASLCMEIDPSFSQDNMVWDMDSFYKKGEKLINSGKRFTVMIADDFGSEADAYDFITESQKNLNHLLEKARTFNMGLFITVPHPKFISKNIRDRISDYEITVLGHNEELGMAQCQIKKKHIRFDRDYPDKKHLFCYLNGGVYGNFREGMVKVCKWNIPKPPQSFFDWYVPFREELANIQFSKSKSEHDTREAQKKKGTLDQIKEDSKKVMQDEDKYIKTWRGQRKVNLELMTAELGFSNKYGRQLKAYIESEYLKD
jgi:septin family protein